LWFGLHPWWGNGILSALSRGSKRAIPFFFSFLPPPRCDPALPGATNGPGKKDPIQQEALMDGRFEARHLFFLLVLGGIPAGPCRAQTAQVIPAGLEKAEGSSFSSVPSGRAPCRAQFLYAGRALPQGPWTVREIRIRRDGTHPSTFEGHDYPTLLWMSNLALDPAAGYSGIFAENRGKDFTLVMGEKKIHYPPLGKPAKAPAPFSIRFVLDKPFTYTGKALLFEFLVPKAGKASRRWYADAQVYPWKGAPPGGTRTYSGKGCPADFYNYGTKPSFGLGLVHYGHSRARREGLPALDLVGRSSSRWGSSALPFDLSPLGAPGCFLYVSPDAFRTGRTTASGYIRFDWGFVPNDPALEGGTYFEQQFVLDPSFNALGLRASRLAACTVGRGLEGRVDCLAVTGYGSGFTLKSPAATKVEAKGLVLELVR